MTTETNSPAAECFLAPCIPCPGAIESAERSESTPSPTGMVEPDTGTQSLQRAESGHDWGSPFEVGGGATSTQVGPGGSGPATDSQYEHHYGVELSAPGEAATLQRLEEANGLDTVRSWANEGMPVQAMGTPSKMQRFRDRKGSPVPWNAEEKNAQSLQRSTKAAENTSPAGETSVPDSVRSVLSSPGKQLDGTIQRAMEDRMGDSFGDVQIHTGPQAAKACDDINARAFTVGNNIAFNSGEYDPSSPESQHVIAHELAHVRQQTGGDVSMLPQEDVQMQVDPDPKLEKEAEETAQRVMSGGELGIQRMSKAEVHVQRTTESAGPEHYGEANKTAIGMVNSTVEDLTQRVEQLEEHQEHLMGTMLEASPGAPEGFDWKEAAVKGVTGFAAGTAAGAFLGPGAALTGLSGAVTGAASAVSSDVAKETAGTLMNDRPGGEAEAIELMYAEMAAMYEEFKEEEEETDDEENLKF